MTATAAEPGRAKVPHHAAIRDRATRADRRGASRFRLPVRRGWPGYVRAGLTVRRYGAQLEGSVEPHALHRGAAGWFLRGALRRADLADRFRFAGGAGVRANIPFGPVGVSWGATEGGVHRIEMGIGQRF